MEMSHRYMDYLKIFHHTKELLKTLLKVNDDYEILFIQGAATEQFSAIMANLMGNITNSVNLPTVNEPFNARYRLCIIHRNVPNMLAQFAAIIAAGSI